MSMSPGQEVPRFQLLSVPLVRCKPPISPLAPTSQFGDIGQVGLLMMQANGTAEERHVPSCHLSYPSIPQNFSLDSYGQLCDSVYSSTNPQYFNTIPLKSTPPKTSHVATPGLIGMNYRMHPPLPPDSRPEYDKLAQIIRHNLFQSPEFQCNHKSESPTCTDDYHLARQSNSELHEETPASAPVVPMTNFSTNSSELGTSSDVFDCNLTNSKENINSASRLSQMDLMEKKVDALYERKQWLLNRLSIEEDKLYRINREEAELTGEWAMMDRLTNCQPPLNGSHASLSKLAERSSRGGHQSVRSSGLLSRLKWRNSRRSKSAHVRLSPDGSLHENTTFRYSALENHENVNGRDADNLDRLSSSPDRQNSAHLEATMPRRLLRWWRQNKRPANDDSRRRQSVGVDESSVSSAIGCTNYSLRTRGSSVPPKEKSPAEHCEQNGTLSNRSSFRYHKNGPSVQPKEERITNGHQSASMPPFPIQSEMTWSPRGCQKLCTTNVPKMNGFCKSTSNGLRGSSETPRYPVRTDSEVQNTVPCSTGSHFLHPQAIALGLPGIGQKFGPTPCVVRETGNQVRQPISYSNYIRSITTNVRPSRWTTIRCGTTSASDSRQDPVPPPPLPPRTTAHGWNQSIPNNGFYLVPRRHHHQYQSAQLMKGVPTVLCCDSLQEKNAHVSSQQTPRYELYGSPAVVQAGTRSRSHHSYSARIPQQWINVPGRPHTAQVLVRLERSSDQHQPITTALQRTTTVPNPPTLLTCKTVTRDHVLTGKQIKIPCLPDVQKVAVDNWRPVPKGNNDFVPIISNQSFDVATTLQGLNRRPTYPQSNGKTSGFANDIHRPIPIIPFALSSASGASSATRVKTAQECNEALRECLKGWELTVDPEPLNNSAAHVTTDSHKTWTLVIPETSRRPINLTMPQVVVQTRFHPIGRNSHHQRGRVREGGPPHNGQYVYSTSANTRKQWPSGQHAP
ncbi:unnamed protein product [Calicophoron daubneyi]|uniref:Uncharacterized protein n=1 Tax=Calicophoron daubneyi TaxID=300641 RepID=A0AAV2TPG7_CALDB